MKFLNDDSPTDREGNIIKITRLIPLILDCDICLATEKMEGGPTGDGKAVYQCPKCHALKTIVWKIDI